MFSNENNHQWLDENGWEMRTVYIQNKKNKKVYSAILNIANAKDGRKILYDINKITEVKDADGASVPLKSGMGAAETITSAINESIPKSNDDVK